MSDKKEPDSGATRPGKGTSDSERAKNRPLPKELKEDKTDPPGKGSRRK